MRRSLDKTYGRIRSIVVRFGVHSKALALPDLTMLHYDEGIPREGAAGLATSRSTTYEIAENRHWSGSACIFSRLQLLRTASRVCLN